MPNIQTVQLNTFDLLVVEGVDSRRFLQGQVSCNVDKLSEANSLQGALCNVKGRVISNFHLFDIDGGCYLRLAADMASIVKPVIDKYIVFSKAQCSHGNGRFLRLGLIGEAAEQFLAGQVGAVPAAPGEVLKTDAFQLVRIAGLKPRFELWCKADGPALPELLPGLADAEQVNAAAWQLEDFRAGIAHIEPTMTEQYLPEALNYDRTGVIDFKKGCYTGQEIIARMYYRGTPKKRLCYLIGEHCNSPPQRISCRVPGNADRIEEGELIGYVNDGNGSSHLLAIMPAELARENGCVFLDGDEANTTELQSLPYALQ